jgi:phospho-N-acetylmuramoyl-pentapeptide-transferase
MLLWLFEQLTGAESNGASVHPALLDKITFRAALAALVSLVLALALGPRLIAWLRARFREPVASDSPHLVELHRHKQSTPTMGGLFVVIGLVAGLALLADPANGYVQAGLLAAVGLGAVGAIDDLAKLRSGKKGISPRAKLAGQILVATAAAILVYREQAMLPGDFPLRLPMTGLSWPLGAWFIPVAVLVIVGSSNAVNLADGLDGLAAGCLLFAVGAMGVLVYVAGHAELAEYLHVPRIAGAGELTVLAAAMIGGVLGFLWFNCHPAQVFLGDTGSLPLGGLLGLLAVACRQEMLLVLIGGVFVAEAASVILQVGYYKWRRKRVFRCAPLHHHFQFQGWPESRIVVRFWIASALCALIGLATLKLNG